MKTIPCSSCEFLRSEVEQLRQQRDRLGAVILMLHKKTSMQGPESLCELLGQAVTQNDLYCNHEARRLALKIEDELSVY